MIRLPMRHQSKVTPKYAVVAIRYIGFISFGCCIQDYRVAKRQWRWFIARKSYRGFFYEGFVFECLLALPARGDCRVIAKEVPKTIVQQSLSNGLPQNIF
jgi:hypothetical protein